MGERLSAGGTHPAFRRTFPVAFRRKICYTEQVFSAGCLPKRRDGHHVVGGVVTQQDELLNLGTELGYELMVSGAEVYRVEDSVGRLLRAYGSDTGEIFAIPNCLTVSMIGDGSVPLTRIRRIPPHGTDIDRLERCNELCRTLCRETPAPEEALARLEALRRSGRSYPLSVILAGYAIGAFGFCLFFQGSLADAVCSGLCCLSIGLCMVVMDRMGSNGFFKSIAASAVSTFLALCLTRPAQGLSPDLIILGALMALVPGICFTGALRDIMAGDMLTGLSKAAEGVLIGAAIVIGSGAAMALFGTVMGG